MLDVSSYNTSQSVNPVFSLVIATLDREEELKMCLTSLLTETLHDFEVIVVDQNADERLEHLLSCFLGRLPLRHLRVPYRNASRARNEGARVAAGKWVAFPDDDCRFMAETMQSVRRLTQARPLDLLSGRTLDERGANSMRKWHKSQGAITPRNLNRTFTESAFFVRCDLFLKVNGFDPLLGPGSPYPAAEGIDLVLRLRDENPALSALFCPSVRFYHPQKVPPYNKTAAQRLRLSGRGSGAVAARYWKSRPFRFILLPLVKSGVAMAILSDERRHCKWEWVKGYCEGFVSYLRRRHSPAWTQEQACRQ